MGSMSETQRSGESQNRLPGFAVRMALTDSSVFMGRETD